MQTCVILQETKQQQKRTQKTDKQIKINKPKNNQKTIYLNKTNQNQNKDVVIIFLVMNFFHSKTLKA